MTKSGPEGLFCSAFFLLYQFSNSLILDKENRDPLVIPLSRGIEGVFRRLPVLIKYLHLSLRLLRQHKG